MLRKNCPFCGKEVLTGPDKMMTENGRGIFKTKIMFHRSCADAYRKAYIRKVARQ